MTEEKLIQLYTQQVQDFELARKNYANLRNAIYRDISFGHYLVRIQYNPDRMISTNAKIDTTSLQARKCFLCQTHMPEAQQGTRYDSDHSIFINPYPIFDQHFTVPSSQHKPQRIAGHFSTLLHLAFDLQHYIIFYNGPTCGASAPDHFHFQIAPRNLMPLEQDVCLQTLRKYIVHKDYYSVSVLEGYHREVILLQASDSRLLQNLFEQTQEIIGNIIPYEEEPMMNILCWFDNCQWTLCILPRQERRPWQFYAEGEEKILFSPGCVDMAGLIISPRKEDFDRYSKELLIDMFQQVTVNKNSWLQIVDKLKKL